ncbi:MAG TPA: TetR/AcrR family transcriptional regulator, partial [Pyrinomonadaceae bacterium]|nr:TetR/AcrR family transcriptional regulator [Pyrinomonadaceae bacterium]
MNTASEERVVSTGRKAQGERTRQAILEAAVHLASAEGLEGLTIGRLASELSMSKSGLFAHFGSKEELQLATVEAAREVFIEAVIGPAFEAEKGLARLWRLCDIWLEYVRREVFSGGCFFAAAAAEFDGRPGPVRDRVAGIMKEWLAALRRSVAEARV